MSDDNVALKPRPLDPGASLNPEDEIDPLDQKDTGPPLERESPFRAAPSPQSKRPADKAGSVMESSFSAHETVPQHIENVRVQLGAINRYFHGQDVQKIQRAHVLKLAKELFDYQFQDMQHLLLLGMDVQKKRRFVQYLAATKDIQEKIQRQSAQAQLAMIDTMFDMRIEAFKAKRARDLILAENYKAGNIDKSQYQRSLKDNENYIFAHEQRLNDAMDQLIVRHSQFLHETLALFKTDLITDGKL